MSRFHEAEASTVRSVLTSGRVPRSFSAAVVVASSSQDGDPLEVQILGRWKFYRGRLEAHRVRGSYEFTRGDFKGEVSTPSVDRLGYEPGPGWERIQQPPDSLQNTVLIILHKGDAEEALMAGMGPKVLAGDV